MKIFELFATLGLDSSGFEKGVTTAKSDMQSLGDKLTAKSIAISTAVGNVIASGAKSAVKGLVSIGKQAITVSADVAAENAQFAATFGDLADTALDAYGKIGKETNILTTRLKATGTKGYAQLKGAGYSANEALEKSSLLLQLASDAAAYYDISLEDADTRLRSFMRGNTEAGDAIGLFTSETQRNTRAMELYKKKWNELTEAQRQNLMLDVANEIYSQSGVIGQAAREGHEWLNVTQNLSESWRQTLANLGEPVREALIPGLEKVTELLQRDDIQTALSGIASAAGEIVTDGLEALINGLDWCLSNGDKVKTAVDGIGTGLLGLAALKFPGIAALVTALNAIGVINLSGQTYNDAGELVLSDGTTKPTARSLWKSLTQGGTQTGTETKIENKSVISQALENFLPDVVSGLKIGINELGGFFGWGYNEQLTKEEAAAIRGRAKKIDNAIDRGEWITSADEASAGRAADAQMDARKARIIAEKNGTYEKSVSGDNAFYALGMATGDIAPSEAKGKNVIQRAAEAATEAVTETIGAVKELDMAYIKSLQSKQNTGNAETVKYIAEEKAAISGVADSYGEAGEAAKVMGAAAQVAAAAKDAALAGGESGVVAECDAVVAAMGKVTEAANEAAEAVQAALALESKLGGGNVKSTMPRSTTAGGAANSIAFGDYDPLSSALNRHASGLPSVPYDGYIAMLHRGEAVLTRRENDDLRAKRTQRQDGVTIVQNIQAVAMRPSELAAQTRHAFDRMRFAI